MSSDINAKRYELKNSVMTITPQTREELRELIATEQNPEYISEYENALKACEEDLDNAIWHTYWKICLKKDKECAHVGGLFFTKTPERGCTGIYFRIFPDYRNKKYATDAVRLFVEWAMSRKEVYEIETEISTENDAAEVVLERAGFVYRFGDRESARYTLTKPKTSWAGLYLIVGIFAGLALGIVFSSMAIGLILGVLFGLGVGASMDISSNKERERITGEKYSRRELGKK